MCAKMDSVFTIPREIPGVINYKDWEIIRKTLYVGSSPRLQIQILLRNQSIQYVRGRVTAPNASLTRIIRNRSPDLPSSLELSSFIRSVDQAVRAAEPPTLTS